jgi:hypothetical protein
MPHFDIWCVRILNTIAFCIQSLNQDTDIHQLGCILEPLPKDHAILYIERVLQVQVH